MLVFLFLLFTIERYFGFAVSGMVSTSASVWVPSVPWNPMIFPSSWPCIPLGIFLHLWLTLLSSAYLSSGFLVLLYLFIYFRSLYYHILFLIPLIPLFLLLRRRILSPLWFDILNLGLGLCGSLLLFPYQVLYSTLLCFICTYDTSLGLSLGLWRLL